MNIQSTCHLSAAFSQPGRSSPSSHLPVLYFSTFNSIPLPSHPLSLPLFFPSFLEVRMGVRGFTSRCGHPVQTLQQGCLALPCLAFPSSWGTCLPWQWMPPPLRPAASQAVTALPSDTTVLLPLPHVRTLVMTLITLGPPRRSRIISLL